VLFRSQILKTTLTIIYVLIILSIMYGVWWAGKSFSYNMMYKGMVEDTVKEMVKKESLK